MRLTFAFQSSFAVLVLVAGAVRAADPPKLAIPPKASFDCRHAAGTITIDGKADEESWKEAEVIDNFAPFWLTTPQGAVRAAFTSCKARLLWDEEFLYFHAEMEDADLYADVTEQDGACWNNDVFELFFKPNPASRAYYEFEVSAANTHLDMFLPSRGSGGYTRWKSERKFEWQTKVVLRGTLNDWKDRDKGWSVEGRFPWKDFEPTGGRPKAGDAWKFALCRYDYSVDFEQPELSTSAPLTRPDYHHYEDYSTLMFRGPQK